MTPKALVRGRGERHGLDDLDVGSRRAFFSANGTLGLVRDLSTAIAR